MSDALAVPDVDALAAALCARPGRGPCAAHRVTAEAVLAVLPSPAEQVRALADDEALMLASARQLNFLAGADEAEDAATILRALAAALEERPVRGPR